MEDTPELYGYYKDALNATESDDISKVERLMNEFETHESKEEKCLEKYKKLAEESRSPLTRFLTRLIISDEEKHRAVTHAMVSTLRGSLTWTKPEDWIDALTDSPETNAKLRALTEEFIRLEKEGIKEYRNLIDRSKGYYYGLFELLLESMIHDSEKHLRFLEFLHKRLKER